MGILRDLVKSAMADSVNNGLGGPNLPFVGRRNAPQYGSGTRQYSTPMNTSNFQDQEYYMDSRGSPSPSPPRSSYARPFATRDDYCGCVDSERCQRYEQRQRTVSLDGYPPTYSSYSVNDRRSTYSDRSFSPSQTPERTDPYDPRFTQQPQMDYDTYARQLSDSPQSRGEQFRPLVLPQIAFGDGQPFLRGYSDELRVYGIDEREFLNVVDALNVAIVPNPENQIFQKGANIAGWFIPGAAGIGLMAGQIGAGLTAAYGKSSSIAKVLSQMNLELFLPRGLEICICSSNDIDAELGIATTSSSGRMVAPDEMMTIYGRYVSPITRSTPPIDTNGRTDPIAMLGRGLASKQNSKALQKAQKDAEKGKYKKTTSLQSRLKWIMVRQASPQAMAYLQRQ